MKLRSPIPPRKARLEIIPLIDVMFFLLASFMMVSLTMSKQQTVKVKLPVATTAQDDLKPDNISLGVNVAGDIFFGQERLALPDLDQRLAESFRRNPALPVYISADADTKYSDAMRAVDAARRAGFSSVALQAKRLSP
jgi:biopolymer transport protein ExbD